MIRDTPTPEWPEGIFSDARSARNFLEHSRWRDGVWCIHCGLVGSAYRLREGGAARPGLWKCGGCRRQFTVTVGTILEDSHLPLHQWLLAIRMCVERQAVSPADLRQLLGITYKTARLLAGRLGYALTQPPLAALLPTPARRVRASRAFPGAAAALSLVPLSFDRAVNTLLLVTPEKRLNSADKLDRRGWRQEMWRGNNSRHPS